MAIPRCWLLISDVDSYVPKGSPIDEHAARETTSVYTGVKSLSDAAGGTLKWDLTSLLEGQDRRAMVIEFVVDGGDVISSSIYPALVKNHAQLAYNAVGAWLQGTGEAPEKVAASEELQAQLKLQSDVAQRLRADRYLHGALNIETIETHPVVLERRGGKH